MKLIFSRPKWLASSIILVVATLLTGGCTPANQSPVISSLTANEEWVEPAGILQIECTASDPDGDELSYTWSADGGSISGEGSIVTWTAPEAPGAYTITAKVTDGRGGEATTKLTIEVAVNYPPIIASLTADKERVIPSGSCQVDCIASAPDADELSYIWSADGGSISGEGSIVTWTAPEAPGAYTITAKVTDGRGGEATAQLTINVVAPHHPPTIENLIVTAKHRYLEEIAEGYRVLQGKAYEIECVASDPDGDELLYEWSDDGGRISGEGAVVTWTAPLRGGKVTVTVTVSDGRGGAATESVVFSVATCAPCSF